MHMDSNSGLDMWNESISCYINKQEMSQPLAISGLQMWLRAQGNTADAATTHPHPQP